MVPEVSQFLDRVGTEYFGNYSDLSELKIRNGILEIHRGSNKRQIDLVHAFIRDRDPRRRELIDSVRDRVG